jgi:hypothetical protein
MAITNQFPGGDMARQKFTRFKVRKHIIGIAAVIIIAAGGLAFALLQSRSVITGNTISTASANLLVSADGTHYSQTIPGFSFDGIIPGGYAAPAGGYPIYLKNTGTTPLDLSLAVEDAPSNPDSADLNDINFGLTDVSGNTAPRGFILQLLMNGGLPIEGELAPGATRQYKLQALAAHEAALGTTISNIDLAFVGTAHDPNDPSH